MVRINSFKITGWIIFGFLILFLLYAGFESWKLIAGPRLNIEKPYDGEYFATSSYEVRGVAKNISYISLNDRQIFIDKAGVFSEKLILLPGYNIIKLEAKDRFGKVVTKKLRLFLDRNASKNGLPQEVTASTATATSTKPTATSTKDKDPEMEDERATSTPDSQTSTSTITSTTTISN